MMLTRDPSVEARLLRRRENARRYRKRQGPKRKRWQLQWVLRSPVYVGSFIEWMVSEGYLADGDIHSRAMLEEALALYIADQISRHR
jgi:hypothetical protein